MLNILNLANTISRLSLYGAAGPRTVSTCATPLYFRVTNVLSGEPLKKKKRLDPAIVRQREDRKKRKLEKQIRRLEKLSRQLKPVWEFEVPLQLIDQKEVRTRRLPALSEEKTEARISLLKEWGKYKSNQHASDSQSMESLLVSQEHALNELKAESEELYSEAVQIDCCFIPFCEAGPVHTPPIRNYNSPDGEYVDFTRKYEGET